MEAIAEQQAKMASAESSAAPASFSKKQQLSTKAESPVIDSSPTKSIDSFLPPSTMTADNSIDNFLADSEETAAVTAAEAVTTADSDDDEVSCNPMVMTRQQDFSSDEDVPTSAAVLRRSGFIFK